MVFNAAAADDIEGKRPLGRPRYRSEEVLKLILRK
jgi:hypothetical protein